MIKKIKKFKASWCHPCTILSENLDKVLESYPDIKLVVYDADEDEEIFNKLDIRSVPQLFFYDEDNVEVHHIAGVCSSMKLKEIIDYHNKKVIEYSPYGN